MERVIAVLLSSALLTASGLLASSVEETYQAALMQEKGEGDLKEAMRLYQQVIEAHEKGEGDESLAARAQLRIGMCQEKIGLAQARQTYEAVRDQYPDQSQAKEEATQRLKSAHQREATIEKPSALSVAAVRADSEVVFHVERHPMGFSVAAVRADSGLSNEQVRGLLGKQDVLLLESGELSNARVRGQLEAVQQQLKQAEQQFKNFQQQQKHAEQQLESFQRQLKQTEQQLLKSFQQQQGVRSIPHFLVHHRTDQHYYHYANSPPVVPYAHKKVAEVPVQWKFRRKEGEHPQQPRTYAAPDFDDSGWDEINIGQAWEDQDYDDYDEGAWYRARFEVEAEEGLPVLMAFGGVDKDAYLYLNGQWIGQHHLWNQPFILDISDHVVRDGENIVALYVYDGMGMGGIYGLINVHQPTEEVDTNDFAANRGGNLEMGAGKNGWPVFEAHLARGEPYRRYAHRPPHLPYAYKKVAAVPVQWKFRPYAEEHQAHQDATPRRVDFDDSNWATIDIGRAWEDQGYDNYDEGAWYRARIEVKAEEGRPVHLAFGGVDNSAYVYVNGIFVGEHHGWNNSFILDISEAVNYKGPNVVAVRVFDGRDMGGIYGTVEVIQPTSDENLDRYLANSAAGRLRQQKFGASVGDPRRRDDSAKKNFWSRLNPF